MRSAIFLAIVLVLMAGSAEAGTVNVNTTGWWNESGSFNAASTPIQAALDNASAGDYILVVETAEYPESLSWTQDGLTLDLNGAVLNGTGDVSNSGVTIAKNGATLSNGLIRGFRFGVYLGGDMANCAIRGISMEDCSDHGIYLESGTKTNLSIADTVITNPGNDGINKYGSTHLDSFTLDNVTINNPRNGIYLSCSSGYWVRNVSIENTTVNGFTGTGLYMNSRAETYELNISASLFSGAPVSGNCVEIYPYGGTLTLLDNTITGSGSYGLGITGSAETILMEDNTIENNANGVYLQNVRDLILPASNSIRDNGGNVYHLNSVNNVTVRDTFLDDSLRAYNRALLVDNSDTVNIFNLTSLNSSENPIYLSGNAANVSLRGVAIEDCSGHGIYLYQGSKTNLSIADTVISNPGNDGINKHSYTHLDTFTLDNVTINNPKNGIYLYCSSGYWVRNVSIEDTNVTGFSGTGLYMNSRAETYELNISASLFSGAPVSGNCVEIYPYGGTLTLLDNTITGSGSYGLRIAGSAETILMEDNTIENSANGIYLQNVRDLILPVSNSIRDNGGNVYHFNSVNNVTVQDVLLDDSVKAYSRAVFIDNSDTVNVFNLTSLNSSEIPVYLNGNLANITLRDVDIEDCSGHGIYLYGGTKTNLTIADTVITNPGNDGINKYSYSHLDTFTLENVTISTPANGVSLYCYSGYMARNVSVSNLTVNGFSGKGFYLYPRIESYDLDISDSTFTGASSSGSCLELCPYGGTLTLENNTLSGSGAYGLWTRGTADTTLVMGDNTIENNANGIYLQSFRDLTLPVSNSIRDNGGNVYHFNSVNNITVQDVFLDNSVKVYNSAVYVSNSDTVNIFNLTSLNASSVPIWLNGNLANVTLRDVDIENCLNQGIYLDGGTKTNLTIADTVIINPRDSGIYKRDSTHLDTFTLENVTISTPANGIYLPCYSGYWVRNVSVSNLTVSGFSGKGFYLYPRVESYALDISDSTFTGAPGSGNCLELYPYGGTLTLENNTLSGSGTYGLWTRGTADTTLVMGDNIIENNANGVYLQSYGDLILPASNSIRDNGGNVYNLNSVNNVTVRDLFLDDSVKAYNSAVYVSNSDTVNLFNFTSLNASSVPIWLNGNLANITLRDVDIENCLNQGIYLDGGTKTNLTIADTVIINPRDSGIYKRDTTHLDTFRVENVTISTPDNGIYLPCYSGYWVRNVSIVNTTVNDFSGNGLYMNPRAESYELNISDSLFIGASGSGRCLDIRPNGGILTLAGNILRDAGGYGLYLDCGADPSVSVRMEDNSIANNANGVHLRYLTADVNDSSINNTANDLNLVASTINTYNTSFDKSLTTLDANSELNTYWYLDLTVADESLSPVEGASVQLFNVTDAQVYSGLTDASGTVPTLTLKEFTKNSTDTIYESPYLISANKVGVGANDSTVDLNRSMSIISVLGIPEPSLLSWGNDLTNNASLDLTIERFSGVGFNVSADQPVDWVWENASYTAGNGTSESAASGSFDTPGLYLVKVRGTNANGTTEVVQWNCTVEDTVPPSSIGNLHESSIGATWINWSWSNPSDTDFNHSMLFLNGTFLANTSDNYYNVTGLADETTYELSVQTVDDAGNINITPVNDSARTPDITPPASISSLNESDVGGTWINWTWKSPEDSDFNFTMVYLDGVFQASTPDNYYNATGLQDNTMYKLSALTADSTGNINLTWVNDTARTPDITPPEAVSNLSASETGYTWINWTWVNPEDPDFNHSMVYLDGVWQANVSSTAYLADGLSEDSSYTLAIRTVDTNGLIGEWANNTAKTAKSVTEPTPGSSGSSGDGFGNAFIRPAEPGAVTRSEEVAPISPEGSDSVQDGSSSTGSSQVQDSSSGSPSGEENEDGPEDTENEPDEKESPGFGLLLTVAGVLGVVGLSKRNRN